MKHLYIYALLVILFSVGVTKNNFSDPGTQTHLVRVYPNPASSVINFEFPESFDKSGELTLTLYNFIGKKMNEYKITSDKISVNLTDYFRGIYVFQVYDKNGTIIDSGKFQVVK